MRKKISVAMTTYNGDKYLSEQLESISKQTLLPDELVICDDASTDATREVIIKYTLNAPFVVRVYVNEKNIGFTKNFEKAISLASGDLIFLCDQDDIWFPNKIKCIAELFQRERNLQIAVNDCEFYSEDGLLSGGSLLKNNLKLSGWDANHINGCCTIITSEFMRICFPLPSNECGRYGHDDWIHLVGGFLGVRKVVDVSYQFYRRHELNVSQSQVYSVIEPYVWEKYRYLLSKLAEFTANGPAHAKMLGERLSAVRLLAKRVELQKPVIGDNKYDSYIEKLKNIEFGLSGRIEVSSCSKSRRFIKACRLYFNGGYKSSSGWRSLVVDLLK